ncbi:DENN domain-containing protein 1A-like isoform X2 [Ornithodoros turicata]|uniref:DENN domain-containing protein 1A-like isoform X2 n=1 Tax=Ornithodoros turicata TaxID=34597 RepID=UPI003139542C
MGSRIRECPSTLIECFCEVVIPSTCTENAWILQKFPESYQDTEMLKSVPEFAYPCEFSNTAVQHFSFVLTSVDSKWTFGFCRHAPNSPTCFVLLSYLPWHETFYKVLNEIAELTNRKDSGLLGQFLGGLYTVPVPEPGFQLRIIYGTDRVFQCACSDHTKLPSIPENRNLTEYYNAVDATNMMVVFASMLHERRILITSKRLSRLSACVQAANALIYPMEWQHIFIPVLPNHLLDYLSAPMPFLIGVPSTTLARVSRSEMGEVVILDADNNKVDTPFDDLQTMPSEIVSSLKRSLRNPTSPLLGEAVSQAFLRTLVRLMGGYRGALRFVPGQKITFDPHNFLQSRPQNLRPFLEKMLQLQIFQQFIEGRLLILNAGKVNNDIFELEVNIFDDSSNKQFKQHYKNWLVNMKKEGGALLKTMKNKANPAVRSAYKNIKAKFRRSLVFTRSWSPLCDDVSGEVKDKGKKAYSNIQVKITGLQKVTQDDMALPQRECGQPRSAPASPVSERRVPVTFRRVPTLPGKNAAARLAKRKGSFEGGLLTSPTNIEEGLEIVSELADEKRSSGSFRSVNLDLMGELEEMFNKCSTGSSPAKSENAIDTMPKEKSGHSMTSHFSNPSLHKVPLPPPPSGRRRPLSITKPSPVNDAPLIRLESQDDDDGDQEILDPLLQHSPKRPTQPPPPPPITASPIQPTPPLRSASSAPPFHPMVSLPTTMRPTVPFVPQAPRTFSTFRMPCGAPPYSPAQQPAHRSLYNTYSTNPFLRPAWTQPQALPPLQQPSAVTTVQSAKDPFADLIDL